MYDTNQVKESKINMFVHKYELFRMKSNKFIADNLHILLILLMTLKVLKNHIIIIIL